jgi:hypothetical protein
MVCGKGGRENALFFYLRSGGGLMQALDAALRGLDVWIAGPVVPSELRWGKWAIWGMRRTLPRVYGTVAVYTSGQGWSSYRLGFENGYTVQKYPLSAYAVTVQLYELSTSTPEYQG